MSFVRRKIFADTDGQGRDVTVIQAVQDCDEIKRINEITRLANGSGTSSFWKNRQYVKIASIPLGLLDEWWAKGIKYTDPNDWPVIKKMLNDKDYEDLRTAPGRI